MSKVVTFGEIMLRLSPPGYERLFQSPRLDARFGGGEANVAVSLAHLGHHSAYVTRLPENPVGDAALRALRAEGVRTEHVIFGGQRLGIYFAETGASQRASTVVYDRQHSAFAEMGADGVDWSAVLTGADWFHTTGITPALSQGARAACRAALAAAHGAGVPFSIDLNFRGKLWTREEAQRVMPDLVRGAAVLFANEEDLQTSLGYEVQKTNVERAELDVSAYQRVAERVASELSIARVAITLRESLSASRNGWSAVLYDVATETLLRSRRYEVELVDRIGAGDSFAAGLLHGLLDKRSLESALEFAVAASALQQTVVGDFNRVSADEIERLAAGEGSGRIRR